MFRRSMILALAFAVPVAMAFGLAASNPAWAGPIDPGFDLLHTPFPGGACLFPPCGTATSVDLESNPIDPKVLGNTDTIVQRKSGLAAGGTGVIEAEIVALSLRSPAPVPGSLFDRTGSFNVMLTLDNRRGETGGKLNPSTGTIIIDTHDDAAGGGTFHSFFDVSTKVILTPVEGGEPMTIFRDDTLSSSGTPWSHTCAPGSLCLAEGTMFDLPTGDPPFTSGNFFITRQGISHTGPHPHVDPSQPIPEPSAVLLIGSGLATFGAVAWRRRRAS